MRPVDEEVAIFVSQRDPGPPILQYPFSMPIVADDHDAAHRLAAEIGAYLTDAGAPTIRQPGGKVVAVKTFRVRPGRDQVERLNGQRIINLEAQYDQTAVDDTVLNETQALIAEKFDETHLKTAGYDPQILARSKHRPICLRNHSLPCWSSSRFPCC